MALREKNTSTNDHEAKKEVDNKKPKQKADEWLENFITLHSFKAASGGDYATLFDLLRNHNRHVDSKDLDGNTLPIAAARHCQNVIVEKLAQRGASLEAKNKNGINAVLAAAFAEGFPIERRLSMLKRLKRLGANMECQVPERLGFDDSSWFIDPEEEPKGFREILREIVAKVERVDSVGNTPLMLAVRRNCVDDVRLYLGGGAKVNVRNNANESPLSLAAERGLMTIGKILLANGAKVNLAVGPDKATALIVAVEYEHRRFAKLLLDYEARSGQKDATGKSAYDYAHVTTTNPMKGHDDYCAFLTWLDKKN